MPARLLVALLIALAAPAGASAHAVISIGGGVLSYASEDTGSKSRLEIRSDLLAIHVYDPGVFGGMQAPPSCRPGRTGADGAPVEFSCPANGVVRLRVEVEADEDAVEVAGPLPRYVDGGMGADRIRTGDAAAEVRGGEGNDDIVTGAAEDTVHAGRGADAVDTGAGADRVDSADGERDTVRCGDGADAVVADTVDTVDTSCESVERRFEEPPATSAEGDVTAPRLALRAARVQRARADRVAITATSSEAGSVSASAYVSAGGINSRVASVTRSARAGRRVRLSLRLPGSARRRIRRDLARGRRPFVAVRVAAADRAGNASPARSLRIRLR